MKNTTFVALISFFILCLSPLGCALDALGTGEPFSVVPEDGAAYDAGKDADIDAVWPEAAIDASSEDSSVQDVTADVSVDTPEDAPVDVPADVIADAAADTSADTSEDVVADVPADTPEDAATDVPVDTPEDAVTDTPEDTVTDAPPTICETYGEDGVLMVYASITTSQSLVIKGTVDFPAVSGETDIPWKYFCWSPKGNGTMACFPCPGSTSCFQPDANDPRVPAIDGSIVDIQPWRAEDQYATPQNTLCNINGCNMGLYIVCSGYTEICRSDNGVLTGSASYQGSGTSTYIHCPM